MMVSKAYVAMVSKAWQKTLDKRARLARLAEEDGVQLDLFPPKCSPPKYSFASSGGGRKVIYLRLQGKTYKAAGKEFGISGGYARVQHLRALRDLRRAFQRGVATPEDQKLLSDIMLGSDVYLLPEKVRFQFNPEEDAPLASEIRDKAIKVLAGRCYGYDFEKIAEKLGIVPADVYPLADKALRYVEHNLRMGIATPEEQKAMSYLLGNGHMLPAG
jgi:hypothetical protein